MMKKLLYIGHAYHKKTKSTVFLCQLFSEEYELSEFYLDPQLPDSYIGLDDLPVKDFDVLVCLQSMPSLSELRRHISWKRGVFFPMYDHVQGFLTLDCPIWYEYRDFRIINFCRKLHEKLLDCGFDSKYIQYVP